MPKECKAINCNLPVFSNGFCSTHQFQRTDSKWLEKIAAARNRKRAAPVEKKPVNFNFKPIPKNSKARAVINRVYEKEGREFRQERQVCEVCPILREAGIKTQCSGVAEAVHHTRGKQTIENLLKKEWWKASCFWGNNWVEANSEVAAELGLKVPDYTSKLSKFKLK